MEGGSEDRHEVVGGVGDDTAWPELQDDGRQAAGGGCMSCAEMHQKDSVQ
jgi:hypothetical protein